MDTGVIFGLEDVKVVKKVNSWSNLGREYRKVDTGSHN